MFPRGPALGGKAPAMARHGETVKRTFVVVRSHGSAWNPAVALEAQAGWTAHAAFMDALYEDGFAALVGPLEGTDTALLVVRADDAEDARRRLEADPWTASDHLRTTSVTPWTLRLGSLETT
jgi:uncharacterized protein YciI